MDWTYFRNVVLGYLGFPHRKDCVWAGSSEEMALNAVLGHSASSVVHDTEHNQAGDTILSGAHYTSLECANMWTLSDNNIHTFKSL